MRNPIVPVAKRLAVKWRNARAASVRMPPRIAFGKSSSAIPRIFYLSPDSVDARGGVRVIYRHVDVLNSLGLDATVIHRSRGYRAHWFANQTRVAAARDVVLLAQDILVVPEMYGSNLHRFAPGGPRLVVLNQAPYYTFAGVPLSHVTDLQKAPVEAILAVSQDGEQLLRVTFEHTPVHLIRSVVDAEVFHLPRTPAPRRRIAFITSRRSIERHALLSTLMARGRLKGWEFVAIEGMSERAVADTLRGAAIFVSLSRLEGFGLPSAEAMACGCYVIGSAGQGGSEYFDPSYCRLIEENLLALVLAVEDAAHAYDSDPAQFGSVGVRASEAILRRYRTDFLREDLRTVFGGLGIQPS